MCNLSPPHSQTDFDPFRNHLCRDVRNQLSSSLLKTIHARNISPSHLVAETFLASGVEQSIQDYIAQRLERYQAIIDQIVTADIAEEETFAIALLLWDQELFFEVHEWLEEKWLKSQGTEKSILQALIRAAGSYLLLEHNRMSGARKTAAKAVESLTLYSKDIPSFMHVSLLISKLKALTPVPPKLGAKEFIERLIHNKRS
jgi:hypothetical protein